MISEIKPFRAYHVIGEPSIEGMDDKFKGISLELQIAKGYSLFINDKFIMAGGFVPQDDYQILWLYVTDRIKKHMKECIKYARFFMSDALQKKPVKTYVRADFTAGMRFANFFGFSQIDTTAFNSIKYAVMVRD